MANYSSETLIKISTNGNEIEGSLVVPDSPVGLILFAHGSGSSRFSPRNVFVAKKLNEARMATFLVDLLTDQEDEDYENRFDIDLLTERLLAVVTRLKKEPSTKQLGIGLFGASTGAAAALKAAVATGKDIKAVVSRGGRVDMAKYELPFVEVPVLLIVGGADQGVLQLNENAYTNITSEKRLEVIPGATHLFEELGTLEKVANLAINWFKTHFIKEPIWVKET